jgi:hypothetical protein
MISREQVRVGAAVQAAAWMRGYILKWDVTEWPKLENEKVGVNVRSWVLLAGAVGAKSGRCLKPKRSQTDTATRHTSFDVATISNADCMNGE